MRRSTRSSIKRAERLGVAVQRAHEWPDLLAFAHLYDQTASRLAQTKGLQPSGEPPDARAAALQVLVRHGSGRLYLAHLEGQPVAGCLFGIWDGSAYYLQNGSSDSARACGAVHAVLHRAITEFMSEGFVRVNLGGVPADARDEASIDHGLYSFKRSFGTVPVACVSGSIVLRPTRARAVQIARRHRTLLRSVRRHGAHARDAAQR
jgi:lipid II:glycine glycyltransferase (peptidoglycan interpeptide bridge formation enzyme)